MNELSMYKFVIKCIINSVDNEIFIKVTVL